MCLSERITRAWRQGNVVVSLVEAELLSGHVLDRVGQDPLAGSGSTLYERGVSLSRSAVLNW